MTNFGCHAALLLVVSELAESQARGTTRTLHRARGYSSIGKQFLRSTSSSQADNGFLTSCFCICLLPSPGPRKVQPAVILLTQRPAPLPPLRHPAEAAASPLSGSLHTPSQEVGPDSLRARPQLPIWCFIYPQPPRGKNLKRAGWGLSL